jgi:hypothetical protein
MILCHKCAGLLWRDDSEDITGLLSCECMSGYVRGFEPKLTRTEAIKVQIAQQESWIDLYISQGREPRHIEGRQEAIDKLKELK